MIVYLDSSAIMKLHLIDEPDGAELREIIAAPVRIATSRLSYVEVRAGLAAARRGGRIRPAEHDRAVAAFHDSWSAYNIVEIDGEVGARAGDFAEAFGLRAGDAVQLASAFALDPIQTVLVAWDTQLRAAARAAGLATHPAGV